MPLTENKIGPFPFISLQGMQIPPAQQKLADDRPGVDGTEFILIGTKGTPFLLISQVDAESYESAHGFLPAYQSLIEDDAVEVVQGGVSCEANGYRCSVLRVELNQPIRPIRGAVGNKIHPPSEAFVEVRWELIAVPLED